MIAAGSRGGHPAGCRLCYFAFLRKHLSWFSEDIDMIRQYLAPAKINLYLQVLGKRLDGYHELGMIMQRVSLYDRIELALVETPGVRVFCEGVVLPPGGENIAALAARRLLDLSGGKCGVEISIDKRIPVAAGLGGGSSDAAAVLGALNEMLGLGISRKMLMAEGSRLGADVPFFLFEGAAWATGIGDVLEKVEGLPSVWYVLVNPGIAVSTAWVYQNLGLTSGGGAAKLPRFSGTAKGLSSLLRNDLEKVTVSRHPVVEEIKNRLLNNGAAGALMSGSGPTVFGVFAEEGTARRAAEAFSTEGGWKVFVVQPV
jgi:4-diphosphocytidyl-2-C-methyl-D-erythritol kinase